MKNYPIQIKNIKKKDRFIHIIFFINLNKKLKRKSLNKKIRISKVNYYIQYLLLPILKDQ